VGRVDRWCRGHLLTFSGLHALAAFCHFFVCWWSGLEHRVFLVPTTYLFSPSALLIVLVYMIHPPVILALLRSMGIYTTTVDGIASGILYATTLTVLGGGFWQVFFRVTPAPCDGVGVRVGGQVLNSTAGFSARDWGS